MTDLPQRDNDLLPALPSPVPGKITRAATDEEAVARWLLRKKGHTQRAYRREAERFLQWIFWRNQTLASLMDDDLIEYRCFMENPAPAELWCGRPVRRRLPNGEPNPKWRPFVSGLSKAAIRQAEIILGGLGTYLESVGYLPRNPWRALDAVPLSHKPIERFLDEETWAVLVRYLEVMPELEEARQAARARWLLVFLYLTGARRVEVSNARMGDIMQRSGRWWWRVTGKRDKTDFVPVQKVLVAELVRYRRAIGLCDLPNPDESTPLVAGIRGKKNAAIKDKLIYLIVKQVLQKAADWASKENPVASVWLRRASTHWLRHTSATHQLRKGVSLDIVSKNCRHSSLQVTGLYLHVLDEHRHDETEKHGI